MANIPKLDTQWFASFCQLGPRPLVATGWIKLWLSGHFVDPNNIETPTGILQHTLWTKDPKTTGIAIESITQWIPELTENRPAIIIKRNAWRNIRLGIDDRMIPGGSDGVDRYANWWQGSHTIFCIAGEGAEAELLGAEVFRELNQFSHVIRRILELKRCQVMEVDGLHILKTNAKENFVVPITLSYVYEEAFKIEPTDDSKLQSLLPNLTIDLANFQP